MQLLTVSNEMLRNGVIQNNDTDADGDDTVSSLEITQIAVTSLSNSSNNFRNKSINIRNFSNRNLWNT